MELLLPPPALALAHIPVSSASPRATWKWPPGNERIRDGRGCWGYGGEALQQHVTKGGAHPASDDNRHTFKDLAESMATGPDPLRRIPHLCHFTCMVTVVNHSCNGRDAVLLDQRYELERRAGRSLVASLPLAHRIWRDVEVLREYRLAHVGVRLRRNRAHGP